MPVGLVGPSAPLQDHQVPRPVIFPQGAHCHNPNALCSAVPPAHHSTVQALSESAKPKEQKSILKLEPFGSCCAEGV